MNIGGRSIQYISPEKILKEFPNVSAYIAKKSDIYSLGIIILEVITMIQPWIEYKLGVQK